MAPPANVAHIVVSGVLETAERFAFGFWCEYNAGEATVAAFSAAFTALANGLATPLATLMGSIADSSTRIDGMDAYLYAGGSTKAQLVAHVDANIAGSGSAGLPPQVALVASLLSGLPGRSQRGRMFLPYTKVTNVGGSPVQLTSTLPAAIAGYVSGVLNYCAAHQWPPRVVSTTKGTAVPVTSVRVDSKLDTMRSRAEQFPALYVGNSAVNQI